VSVYSRLSDRLSSATFYVVDSAPIAIVSADLDGDGNDDLVAVCHGTNTVCILMYSSSLSVFMSRVCYSVGVGPVSAAVGLLVGADSFPDIAVVTEGGDFQVLQNNGNGVFSLVQTLSLNTSAKQVSCGDLNSDIWVDCVISLHYNNSGSFFSPFFSSFFCFLFFFCFLSGCGKE
jgi:hypothetical protein